MPRDDSARNHCLDHPEHKLDLYCKNCDKYLCTKCLIKKRDEHYDHDVTEVEEMLAQATQDLDRNINLNRQLQQRSQHLQSQTLQKMMELKASADDIENKLFEFHKMMLDQLSREYNKK